jgi:hypothetical protein
LAASQARSSSRSLVSSAVRFKSIYFVPPGSQKTLS